ncbi:NUDIX hydrolase [Acetobacteraceae bacterium H6797]|nr:NUDIX hydrolase [Acetobacteraceae bacterium H6797]
MPVPPQGVKDGAWEVLDSQQLFKDRWLNVKAEKVRTARGHVLDPYYVLSYADWVQVVALTPADELILVRQYRHGAQRNTLELPAGAMEPGESDAVAAGRREFIEETGFDAADWQLVSTLHPNTATHRNRCHTVLALGAFPAGEQKQDPGEDIQVQPMPLAEVLAGLGKGLLPQAMHVSALLLALSAAGRLDLASALRQPAG